MDPRNPPFARVRQVMASLSGVWQAVQIIRPDGRRAADIRPLVRLNVTVVVEKDGRYVYRDLANGVSEARGLDFQIHLVGDGEMRPAVEQLLAAVLLLHVLAHVLDEVRRRQVVDVALVDERDRLADAGQRRAGHRCHAAAVEIDPAEHLAAQHHLQAGMGG